MENANEQTKAEDVVATEPSEIAIANKEKNATPPTENAAPISVDTPADSPVPTDLVNLKNNPYHGASMLTLSKDETFALREKFDDDCFDITETGEVYLSHIYCRDRLNCVLGATQWAIIPTEETFTFDEVKKSVHRKYALYIRGCFVEEVYGRASYYTNNKNQTYADAVEAVKSSAITRACKTLGVGRQCWERRFRDRFIASRCVFVQRGSSSKFEPSKKSWRLKDASPFFDETGLVAESETPVSNVYETPREIKKTKTKTKTKTKAKTKAKPKAIITTPPKVDDKNKTSYWDRIIDGPKKITPGHWQAQMLYSGWLDIKSKTILEALQNKEHSEFVLKCERGLVLEIVDAR